jgi:acyl carrier protein
MGKDTTHWLVHWLKKRNPGLEISGNSKLYDDGLIDSFGIIELLEETEKQFSISFDDRDLTRYPFSTADDFAKIIDKKISKK